ncbi:hypothetical protein GOV05_00775 [Candidatus Woesearchaeota archaeon]|nr:hypothetical protein [Candidatus Woesearchaeota archaeon]
MSLDELEKMKYPGRVIIIGQSPKGENMALYAITGRSPSSQARKLEEEPGYSRISVRVTDEDALSKGDRDLLVYPAIQIRDGGVVVSNGIQTKDIGKKVRENRTPKEILEKGLEEYSYEPDKPNFTPRISGVIFNDEAALSILKKYTHHSSWPNRGYFPVPLVPGEGKLITTYTGQNRDPLPSFEGEPISVELPFLTVEDAVERMYEALGPKPDQPDFRVSAAGIYIKGGEVHHDIINRHDS